MFLLIYIIFPLRIKEFWWNCHKIIIHMNRLGINHWNASCDLFQGSLHWKHFHINSRNRVVKLKISISSDYRLLSGSRKWYWYSTISHHRFNLFSENLHQAIRLCIEYCINAIIVANYLAILDFERYKSHFTQYIT